jgi:hypothetical protein
VAARTPCTFSMPVATDIAPSGQPPPGDRPVGATGVLVLAGYLGLASFITLHVLYEVWPEDARGVACVPAKIVDDQATDEVVSDNADAGADAGVLARRPDASSGHPPDGGAAGIATSTPPKANSAPQASPPACRQVTILGITLVLSGELLLLLLVAASGALGGLVYAIRSFVWYVGNRELWTSWALKYVMQPLVASMLAVLFFLIIRGGFFSWNANGGQVNPFGFAAVGCLIGMFSDQAVLKLKELAETIFTKPPHGKNPMPQDPPPAPPAPAAPPPASAAGLAITSIEPARGLEGGAETVVIKGRGFRPGVTVTFGGEPVAAITVVLEGTLEVVTPSHPAGKVNVVVTQDQQSDTLVGGFEYR